MPRVPLLALALFLLLLPHFSPAAVRERPPAVGLSAPAASGEVLVRLRPPYARLADAVLERRLGGTLLARLPEIDTVRLGLPPGESLQQAIVRLARLPEVMLAEPNHLLRAGRVPNDPFFSAQSGYLELIEAPAAWDITRGDAAVLVAVLDSGIDLRHPDLQGKYWTNPRELAGNGVDDDANGCIDDLHGCSFVGRGSADPSCAAPVPWDVSDDNGHGTFVAGIIAAAAGNGIGISGAAPGVTVLPVKILDCRGGGTAVEAVQGILYAARSGARVANISFGADGESMTLANAIREAHDRYGMVIVAATGNDGHAFVGFPARLPQTIAVASSGMPGDHDVRSSFSDWGPEVAVAAPGLNIVSTVPPTFCGRGWFCIEEQPYAVSSGTSFAAPLVSALAALLVSRTPNLSPEAVRDLIMAHAEPLPHGNTPNWAGAGRIRMHRSLQQPRYYLGAPGVGRN